MSKGKLITFEGIDGIGKSTQSELLVQKLVLDGYPVTYTKEPGQSVGGSVIRDLLFVNPTTNKMFPGQADCLYLYDHIGNVEGIVRPALERGEIVVSDRYADSQFAYTASKLRATTEGTAFAFKQLYGIQPDIIVLLIASIKETGGTLWTLKRAIGRRGDEARKQQGKAWGLSSDEQLVIQTAYMSQLGSNQNLLRIIVDEEDTKDDVFKKVYASIENCMER